MGRASRCHQSALWLAAAQCQSWHMTPPRLLQDNAAVAYGCEGPPAAQGTRIVLRTGYPQGCQESVWGSATMACAHPEALTYEEGSVVMVQC